MALPINKLQLPDELKDIILSGKCVAFIGSGLSAGCYDSWHELVNNLCERCGSSSRVERNSSSNEFLDAAQDAKGSDEQAYYSFLGEHFGRPVDKASLLYDAILSLPFECYLTVNFDPLLAIKSRTSKISCDTSIKAYPSLDRKCMTNRSIHYLHGYIEEKSTPASGNIVLSRGEFVTAYKANSNLMNFLVPTLENDCIVYIGCRLKEPVMPKIFAICQEHQKTRIKTMVELGHKVSNPPKQFILLPEPEVRKSKEDIDIIQSKKNIMENEEANYKSMGITSVWYKASGNDHSNLRYALENLVELPDITPHHGWDGGAHGT
jgi:SIR2-like protein